MGGVSTPDELAFAVVPTLAPAVAPAVAPAAVPTAEEDELVSDSTAT